MCVWLSFVCMKLAQLQKSAAIAVVAVHTGAEGKPLEPAWSALLQPVL